jgi:cytochrome c biogenesis protein CcmG/thiol:disulfide interchange protein DsbE
MLVHGLSHQDRQLPSVRVGHDLPDQPLRWLKLDPLASDAPEAAHSKTLHTLLNGKVTLLQVWATWCTTCQVEHSSWQARADQLPKGAQLIGVLYHDDVLEARKWLHRYGNPFAGVIDDGGRLSISLGVSGTPELYLIDQNGRVQAKWIGLLRPEVWEDCLKQVKAMMVAT